MTPLNVIEIFYPKNKLFVNIIVADGGRSYSIFEHFLPSNGRKFVKKSVAQRSNTLMLVNHQFEPYYCEDMLSRGKRYNDQDSPSAVSPSNSKATKNKFSPQEDEALIKSVQENGSGNWYLIASQIPGRTPRQCRDRYNNYLSPSTNLQEWTKEEDEYLIEQYQKLGNKWSKLSQFFPGRPSSLVRNRCCKLLRLETTKGKASVSEANSEIISTMIFQNRSNLSSQTPKIILPPCYSLPFPHF